jgi:large subunit ribosomal protein L6
VQTALVAKLFATSRKERNMSRVGKSPIPVPKGAEISINGANITVKGPLGTLTHHLHPSVGLKQEDGVLTVVLNNNTPEAGAQSGTARALVNNMVVGVTAGFERKLSLVGVGYRAAAQGDSLKLQLGFSHDIIYNLPKGVKAETPTQTEIIIKGSNKQQVGQVAAEVRAYRSPEPYKGKGVRYVDEVVHLKETKKK